MTSFCPTCKQEIKKDELVVLMVIAPYHPIPSKVSFSIGTPVSSVPESLEHLECFNQGDDYDA